MTSKDNKSIDDQELAKWARWAERNGWECLGRAVAEIEKIKAERDDALAQAEALRSTIQYIATPAVNHVTDKFLVHEYEKRAREALADPEENKDDG
jgi:hypothetical protein